MAKCADCQQKGYIQIGDKGYMLCERCNGTGIESDPWVRGVAIWVVIASWVVIGAIAVWSS